MKVQNMMSRNGNKVANQFIINTYFTDGDICSTKVFQSYDSAIVQIDNYNNGTYQVTLDRNYWDYSVTTGKYRNQFLRETKKETLAKIDSGEYILADLNN
jgi:hypothetical protein